MTHIPPVLQPINWEPSTYISPEELQRRERVAVGRICRCGKCICCEEARRYWYHKNGVEVT
jgi:hypothetical protein